jgi:hypothetical protein
MKRYRIVESITLILFAVLIIMALHRCNNKEIPIDSNEVKQVKKIDRDKDIKAKIIVKTKIEYKNSIKLKYRYDTTFINDTFYIKEIQILRDSSKWIDFETSIKDSVANVKFSLTNEMNIKTTQRNRGIYISATNSNPHIKTTNINATMVRIKHPIVTTGINAGVGYDVLRNQVIPIYVGAGVNISLSEIKKRFKNN